MCWWLWCPRERSVCVCVCVCSWVWKCVLRTMEHTLTLNFGPWISGHFGFLSRSLCRILLLLHACARYFLWKWNRILVEQEKNPQERRRNWSFCQLTVLNVSKPHMVNGLFTLCGQWHASDPAELAKACLPTHESFKITPTGEIAFTDSVSLSQSADEKCIDQNENRV